MSSKPGSMGWQAGSH